MFKVGFCVSGQGRLFKAAVLNRKKLGITPELLIMDEKASDLSGFCGEHGIREARLDSKDRAGFDAEFTRILKSADLDLVALTFDKLVRPEAVKAYRGRMINTHMSILPSFKGFRAIERAVEGGVKFAGATIHEVNEEMDAGSIISQCITSVQPTDTAEEAGKRIYKKLLPMYQQVLAWYAAGRVWRDAKGRLWVKDADYSDGLVCPKLEQEFESL